MNLQVLDTRKETVSKEEESVAGFRVPSRAKTKP